MGEDAWVFDSLVGFLRGPVWNVPILTFIEHKSLVFEPGEDDKNEAEYKKIHEDYKNLVDFMLGSYMEDIGITPTQFETACGVGTGKNKTKFTHGLFEQVWAADDFEIFKRMMVQKNIELQLQALELLQQRYGVLPESLQPGKKGKEAEMKNENEDKVMLEVVRQSKDEHEAHVAALDKEEAELEQVIANSLEEHKRLSAAKQGQEALLAEHFKKVHITDPTERRKKISDATPQRFNKSKERSFSSSELKKEEIVITENTSDELFEDLNKAKINNTEEASGYTIVEDKPKEMRRLTFREDILIPEIKSDSANHNLEDDEVKLLMDTDDNTFAVIGVSDISAPEAYQSNEEIDPAELERRTTFLKAQRDKLLALKKAEREKQLAMVEATTAKSRPKSAKAARSAMGRHGPKNIDPKTLQIRKTLAEKLKQEVIAECEGGN